FLLFILPLPISTLFPTRRSSDLAQVALDEESPKLFIRSMDLVSDYQKRKVNTVVLRLDPAGVNAHLLAQLRATLVRYQGKCPTRSEEHTSELQSLRHLVCRLLLE